MCYAHAHDIMCHLGKRFVYFAVILYLLLPSLSLIDESMLLEMKTLSR